MQNNARTKLPKRIVVAVALSMACSAPSAMPELGGETLGTGRAADTAFPNDRSTYHYFLNKGFTNFQAAAIVGNLDQESGINPTISQQNGGPGRGIAQWSAGGRWDSDPGDNVVAYATQQGQSPDSLDLQLDFIMYELQTFTQYGLVKLKASTNVDDATTDFELDFEGCGIPDQCDGQSRINYAHSILDAYGNDPPDTDAGSDAAADGPSPPSHTDASAPSSGQYDAGSQPAVDAGAPPAAAPDAGTPLAANGNGNATQAASGCAVGARACDPSWPLGLAMMGLVLRRRRRARA